MTNCPTGFYKDSTTRTCLTCDLKCLSCDSKTICTSCATNFRLFLGKCICNTGLGYLEETIDFFDKKICKNPCDPGFYGDDTTFTCTICHTNC